MNNQERTEHIIKTVDQMRQNSEEMRIWKNVPLAKECLELLQAIDDPEEAGIGKALACNAIVERLSEYDVPRLTLEILRYQQEQLDLATESDLEPYLYMKDEVAEAIQRLEDYIDTEHIGIDEFRKKHHRHLKSDPVERTPLWEEIYYEVEQECDRRLGDTPRGMGFCFSYWSTLQQVLAERNIEWKSPKQLNPRVMFD